MSSTLPTPPTPIIPYLNRSWVYRYLSKLANRLNANSTREQFITTFRVLLKLPPWFFWPIASFFAHPTDEQLKYVTVHEHKTTMAGEGEGWRAIWVRNPARKAEKIERVLFYVHGGAFISGHSFLFPEFQVELIDRMNEINDGGVAIFSVEYTLAPAASQPQILSSVISAYKHLLTLYLPSQISLLGDCAGGNLILGLLLSLSSIEKPSRQILVSPWVHPTHQYGPGSISWTNDWIGPACGTTACAAAFGPGWDKAPLHEQIQGDMFKVPLKAPKEILERKMIPCYLVYGRQEVLFDDLKEFAERLRDVGVDVVENVGKEELHEWCMDKRFVKEHGLYAKTVDEIGRFALGLFSG